MPRWSEKQSCTFVSLYKDFDCLWNVFDPSYKNRGMRIAAFEYIVKVMNIPSFTVNDVPKKIRSFRSTYNQELLKVSKSQKSGADDDDVYYPTVKWFDDMDYIMKNSNVADRPTMTDVEILNQETIEVEETVQTVTGDDDDPVSESQDPLPNNQVPAPRRPALSPTRLKRAFKLPQKSSASRFKPDVVVREALAIIKDLQGGRSARDQFTVFGEQVGMQIRDLPSPCARKIVKHMISTLLFDAEMGKYDNPSNYPLQPSTSNAGPYHFPQPPTDINISQLPTPGTSDELTKTI